MINGEVGEYWKMKEMFEWGMKVEKRAQNWFYAPSAHLRTTAIAVCLGKGEWRSPLPLGAEKLILALPEWIVRHFFDFFLGF